MPRSSASGSPESDVVAAALESKAEARNPSTGETLKGEADYPRVQSNFIGRQFPQGVKIEDFKGVEKPSRAQQSRAAAFKAFKSERDKIAAQLTPPKGKEIITTRTGAIWVRDSKTKVRASGKGIIPEGLGSAFKQGPKFASAPSDKPVIVDQAAFEESLREAAKSEGDSFVATEKGASSKQVTLFEDAIRKELGL